MTTERSCTDAQTFPLPTLSTPPHSESPARTEQEKRGYMLSHIRQHAPSLLHRLQSGLSKLPVELVWTAHSQWPLPPAIGIEPPQKPQNTIRVSVLDSSFNPPTLAHLALANSPRPSYTTEPTGTEYAAKLLLLSVKNVDKALKTGDATYFQRLQMMGLLAEGLSVRDGNVAIAITDEPTFVGKSKVLQEYLRTRLASLYPEHTAQLPSAPHTQLSFIVGLDTLERLFSPKYYPPSPGSDATHKETMIAVLSQMLAPHAQGGDDSLVVCARRTVTLASDLSPRQGSTRRVSETEGWMKEGMASGAVTTSGSFDTNLAGDVLSQHHEDVPKNERIVLIDIGDPASTFSSTATRNARSRTSAEGADIREGLWREWVTPEVANYVEKEGLYIS